MKRSLRRISLESRIEDVVAAEPVIVADPAVAEVVDVPTETVVVVPTSDLELNEIAEAQAEAGDTVDAISELVIVADRLGEVRGNIEATMANGGLTQGEAVAYQCATNAIVADVGVSEVLPSMENFGANMSRKEATKASLEALDKVLSSILDRAKELLVGLGEKIVKVVKRIIAYFTSDKSRLEKLKEALKGSSGNTTKIKVPTEFAAFTKAGLLQSYLDASESVLGNALSDSPKIKVNFIVQRKPLSRTTLLPNSTHKSTAEADVHTASFGLIEMVESLPKTYENVSEYEAYVENKGDGETEITITKADTLAIVEVLLKAIDSKQISKYDNPNTIKAVTSLVDLAIAGAGKLEDTDDDKEACEHARAIVLANTSFALSVLSTYAQVFQGMVTLASKATSELTKAAPASLPAPKA